LDGETLTRATRSDAERELLLVRYLRICDERIENLGLPLFQGKKCLQENVFGKSVFGKNSFGKNSYSAIKNVFL